MSTRHKPDHELQLMLRVLRDLQALPPAGRQRVLAYWNARAPEMPVEGGNRHGEQQLDITDVIPAMPPLHGATA
jgi:hypothetical protein